MAKIRKELTVACQAMFAVAVFGTVALSIYLDIQSAGNWTMKWATLFLFGAYFIYAYTFNKTMYFVGLMASPTTEYKRIRQVGLITGLLVAIYGLFMMFGLSSDI